MVKEKYRKINRLAFLYAFKNRAAHTGKKCRHIAFEQGINIGDGIAPITIKRITFRLQALINLLRNGVLAALFTYQTGKAATYPIGRYQYQGITIANYGERNVSSLPAYHHLDLSASYTPKPDSKKRWKGEWVFEYLQCVQ